jgi:hypothetical protein
MTKVNWQDHFKSAIQNAESLYSKDSTDVSLLMFCLRSKLISSASYLAWAKENFQIPVLSEKFFQIHTPQRELYKKWQKVHKWTKECLPVAEWDGVLIVACLEIPENYASANPTTFVLTSYEVLDQTWATYTKSEDDNFFDAHGEFILKDNAASEQSSEKMAKVSVEEEASGVPEGLFGDSPAPKIEPLTSLTKTELIPFQPMNSEVTKEFKVEIENEPAPIAKQPTAMHTTKKGPRTSETLMVTIDEKTKIDNFAAYEGMEEVADHEVQFPDKKQISPIVNVTTGEFPSAPVKPTMNPADSAAYFLEKVRKQGQDPFDKEVIASFQHMKTFFKKSMLLAISNKDRSVKPILWDAGFEQKAIGTEFNLKTPSIFKIVNGTQKPYHGYVVPNDLNESFFETWNHGQIPDHVTIVPLMDGDHVIGMIMGFGEKASYNKNVLQFTENLAKGLSSRIMKTLQPKVA